jgi:Tfp pilus assembly protein PilO
MNPSILNKLMVQIADLSTGRLALLGAVLAGIYYGTLFNDGSSIRQNIVTLKSQIEEEKIKEVETKRILLKEEQMRGDVTLLVKKYEDVKSKIPIEFLESELRIIINQLATQFDLKTIKNQRAAKGKDFGSAQDANLVDQVALDYSFTGTYFNLEKLLVQISSLDKLIKIENFQFSNSDKKSNDGFSREINLKATIVGFKQSQVSLNENKKSTGTK